MTIMKRLPQQIGLTFFLSILLVLSACVTINVYFPASQAERAAERIVDEILGEPDQKQENGDNPKDALLYFQQPDRLFAAFSEFLIPSAHAAQPNFSVNTPEIKRLRSSMSSRNSKLSKFYSKGAVGFDKNGLVAWKDKGAVSIKERGTLNGLLKAENNDRNKLYRAIANANGHPEWEKDVRNVFAKKWSQKARKGWWYQTSSGSWKQK